MKQRMKKFLAAIMSAAMCLGALSALSVSAAQDYIEFVFKDVTAESTDVLDGEVKVQVSVVGAGGSVSVANLVIGFSGMDYKAVEYHIGSNGSDNNETYELPALSTANEKDKIETSLTLEKGGISITDDETKLCTFTFNNGSSVKLKLDKYDTFLTVNRKDLLVDPTYTPPVGGTFTAGASGISGKTASVRIVMDKVGTFTAANEDYLSVSEDNWTQLKITSDQNPAYSLYTTLGDNTSGHRLNGATPEFLIQTEVPANYTYTVELSSRGCVTYKAKNVSFDSELVITNSGFVPGDVNRDGKVNDADKTACENAIGDHYNYLADVNRDFSVDELDLAVFDAMLSDVATVPAKVIGLQASATGTSSVRAFWAEPSDGGSEITGYTVKYGTSSNALDGTLLVNENATSAAITGLSAGTKYYISVFASNSKGDGEASAIASVTTDSLQPSPEDTTTEPEKYTVTFSVGEGKLASGVLSTRVLEGAVVKSMPTVTPPEGKVFKGWSSDGVNVVDVSKVKVYANTKYTALYESTVKPDDSSFTDLGSHTWAKESVYLLKDKGIISGVSATEFAPSRNIKRGDFILILTRMLSTDADFTSNFRDVPKGSYYYDAIGRAKAAGIATGDGVNFMPENSITRQDLITLAYRAFLAEGYIEATTDRSSLDAFGDKQNIASYAADAMAAMVSAGIIKGDGGYVNPQGNATRAEVAVMCARLLALMD